MSGVIQALVSVNKALREVRKDMSQSVIVHPNQNKPKKNNKQRVTRVRTNGSNASKATMASNRVVTGISNIGGSRSMLGQQMIASVSTSLPTDLATSITPLANRNGCFSVRVRQPFAWVVLGGPGTATGDAFNFASVPGTGGVPGSPPWGANFWGGVANSGRGFMPLNPYYMAPAHSALDQLASVFGRYRYLSNLNVSFYGNAPSDDGGNFLLTYIPDSTVAAELVTFSPLLSSTEALCFPNVTSCSVWQSTGLRIAVSNDWFYTFVGQNGSNDEANYRFAMPGSLAISTVKFTSTPSGQTATYGILVMEFDVEFADPQASLLSTGAGTSLKKGADQPKIPVGIPGRSLPLTSAGDSSSSVINSQSPSLSSDSEEAVYVKVSSLKR